MNGNLKFIKNWSEEKNKDINIKDRKVAITCLMYVCGGGYNEVVSYLLSRGAQIEDHDSHGRTPLMWASMRGHLYTVKILLEAGADINATSKWGSTAIEYAQKYDNQDIAQYLRQQGASESIISHKIGDE